MTDLLRRFRSVGIALAVLAISASVALAAAPPAARVSSHVTLTANEQSETPEPAETAEPTEAPKTAEPTESPEAQKVAEPAEGTEASQDAHGALVSAAAKMPTPAGFKNHGAFVSCVAHMDGTLATVVWSTVTPEFCNAASNKAAKSAEKTAAAKVKADAGKARGQAARASHGKSKNHPTPTH